MKRREEADQGHDEENHSALVENPMDGIRCLAMMNISLKADMPFQKAVALARSVSRGAVRKALDAALKRTLLGRTPTLDRTVEDELNRTIGRENWISSSIHDDLIALSEPDIDTRGILLDRSFDFALDSCRSSVKETASGLRVPISTVFALGIVLPIIIATILPLWGMISTDILSSGSGNGLASIVPEKDSRSISLLLSASSILFFPIFCVYATEKLLKKKLKIEELAEAKSQRKLIFILCAITIGAFIFLLLGSPVPAWVFGLACIVFLTILGLLDRAGRVMEKEHMFTNPTVLSMISSRLISGDHFVRATTFSAGGSKEARKIFWHAMFLAESGSTVEGRFEDETSRLISEASDKDPHLAAKMLRQMARHLCEMASIEREMRMELKPLSQSVLVATVFLSPFVLGIVSGFGSIGLLSNSDSQSFFDLIFIAFIIEMTVTGIWLIKYINPGGPSLPSIFTKSHYAVAISYAIFVISAQISTVMFS